MTRLTADQRFVCFVDTFDDKRHESLCGSSNYVFRSLADANAKASDEWSHLTRNEKERSHVYVGAVYAHMLDPFNVEEYGEDEAWKMISDCYSADGAFDSLKEV